MESNLSSARTSTRLNSLDPSWEGEQLTLRTSVAIGLLSNAGANLVARVQHQSMLGSDEILGEAVISLLPMLNAQTAVHFTATLSRNGCCSGTLDGTILVLADEQPRDLATSDDESESESESVDP